MKLRIVIAISLLLLSGCTTVKVSDKGRSGFFIGAVRVQFPEKTGSLRAVDVKSLGLGWDSGPFLGWHAGNWVVADPRDCQLLVVIRSATQAENAVKVLQALGDQKPCVADFTKSLSP